jgi:transcriptional regulator with XRE-family HTH domain
MKTFSQEISDYVKEFPHSIQYISQKSNMSHAYLSMIVNRQLIPRQDKLDSLCKTLNLSPKERLQLFIKAGIVPHDCIEEILSKVIYSNIDTGSKESLCREVE